MKRHIILIFVMIFQLQQIIACSCVYPTEIPKAYDVTNTIVYGEIIELRIIKVSDSMDADSLSQYQQRELTKSQIDFLSAEFLIEAKLKKKELVKGEIEEAIITVYTTRTGASCGYTRFQTGKEYIVYLSPRSYFFSNLYEPQIEKKLEKPNTFWATSCSITSEYEIEHLEELRKINDSEPTIKISKTSLEILKREDLLKDDMQIYASIFLERINGNIQPFEFYDDELITNIEVNRQDLIIRILSIENDVSEIEFKSFDDSGYIHIGTILLKKRKEEWMKESINYVTEQK